MRIYHNIPALTAYNSLNKTNGAMQKSIEKLSTGLRINSAADDAAGFAISEKMRAQITGMEMAQRNAQDGISMLQTAEGALSETHSILQRMRELSVQAANDTLTQEDRSYIQLEIDQLKDQVNNIANTTQFNKKRLLDGSCAGNWSSNDLRVKAYVRGSLREIDQFGQKSAFEGNFRVKIEAADAGTGEVQKSSIFKIKHPNVILNATVNNNAGVESVRVDNIPAGSYTVASETADTTTTYTGTLTSAGITSGTASGTAKITIKDGTDTVEATVTLDTSGEANAEAVITAINTAFTNATNLTALSISDVDASTGVATFSSTNGDITITIENGSTTATETPADTGIDAFDTTDTTVANTDTILTGAYGLGDEYHQATLTVGSDNTLTAGKTGTITVSLADGGSTTVNVTIGADGAETKANIISALKEANLSGLLITTDSTAGTVTLSSTKGAITISQADLSNAALGSLDKTTAADQLNDNVSPDKLVEFTNNAKNNASILFEVKAVNNGVVTLRASADVLTADGKVENHALEDIMLTAGSGVTAIDISSLMGESAGALTMKLADNIPTGLFSSGNKFVFNIAGSGTTDNPADVAVKISGTQDMTWSDAWGDEDSVNYVTHNNAKVTFNVDGDAIKNREVHFHNFYLNEENGQVYEGDVILTTNDNANGVEPDQTLATFDAAYIGKLATSDSKLRDLDKFWNASGVFMLEDPQTITITQGDGKTATVTLYATDTLEDMRAKLNNAIANDLGQGKYVTDHANSFVTFVDEDEVSESGLQTVQGTFIIRSILPGAAGSLTFSGDEDFINAFATNVINSGTESTFIASIYDAHSGSTIASSVKVTGNKLVGVIHENVDLEFDNLADLKATWSDTDKNFIIGSGNGYEAIIHLTDSSTIFQIGANEGEDIAIDIGNMSAASLGINNINVTTRASAMKAVGYLDAAITMVSSQRAKIGAYQNALEWTSENLSTTATNLTAAESRIRDADMAKEMMEFVKLQILNQSGTSMLAQANQLPQSVLSLLQ